MTKDQVRSTEEALRLALEAMETSMYPQQKQLQAITAVKAALSSRSDGEAKGEIDWKDMYEKQKRHTEMWVAKYEKDIGPLEKAVPQQEAKNEPVTKAIEEQAYESGYSTGFMDGAIKTLEAKDEPVAWVYPEFWQHLENLNCGTAYRLTGIGRQPLYTTPPQRTWVGLTDEEIQKLRYKIDSTAHWTYDEFAIAIEAKLKEKNT